LAFFNQNEIDAKKYYNIGFQEKQENYSQTLIDNDKIDGGDHNI
jgi:hypothetical protein